MSAVGDVFTVEGMPAGRVTRVLDGGLVAVAFPSPFGGDWIYRAACQECGQDAPSVRRGNAVCDRCRDAAAIGSLRHPS